MLMFITSIASLLSISSQLCQRNKLCWFDTSFFLDKSMSYVFYHHIILEVLINCPIICSRIFSGIRLSPIPQSFFLSFLKMVPWLSFCSTLTLSSPLWILEKFIKVWLFYLVHWVLRTEFSQTSLHGIYLNP